MVMTTNPVKQLREKLGLTQREFALRLGISVGALGHLERGEVLRLSDRTAQALGQLTGEEPETWRMRWKRYRERLLRDAQQSWRRS